MKRFLAILAALVTLSLCTTIPVPAQESTAVGQPMPDMRAYIDQNHLTTVGRTAVAPDGRMLYTVNMFQQTPRGMEFVGCLAFMKCPNTPGSDIPFGVLIMTAADHAVLMLDNAPCDGIIDAVYFDPQNRSIFEDMPSCS